MEMERETCIEKVMVLCYWNGCVKYGPDGVYYEGSIIQKFRVKTKSKLTTLLNGIYPTLGLDKHNSKLEIFGRYPVAISPHQFTYAHLPVVNDTSLETMLEVPGKCPSIDSVELYLELKSTSDGVVDPAACSSPLVKPGSSSKRQRIQQEKADMSTGSDGCLNKVVESSVLKPCLLSSLWLDDDHALRVGLCFKDKDELKKAVDWYSFRGCRKCTVRETEKDGYMFECVRWKCKWSLSAARKEEHMLVEITNYTGPHTCCPIDPDDSDGLESEFGADEFECIIRVQPTLSIPELKKLWMEKTGNKLKTGEIEAAKLEAIGKVFRDWDQSFTVLPKLMAVLHLSNGLVVDWRYDVFPNPEFASFRGVFWAFSQSIEGFPHCRPLITVDSKDFNGKYPMTFMIASGLDAANNYFPLAFAVINEASSDSWRWFLTEIREKVTQRKGLCVISSPHPDILAVINEPGSRWQEPWAYHRVCLNHLCSQFHDVFKDDNLKNLVKKAGSTSQEEKFDSYMKDIEKKNPEARKWLDALPRNQWSLAHDGGRRYGMMHAEKISPNPFFKSVQPYGLSMTGTMLLVFDELRSLFDKSFSSSRGCLNRGDVYTKPVMEKLEKFIIECITYVITPLDKDAFQVRDPSENDGWVVQLKDSVCTCGEFQADKFPCLHALAVCDKLKINPLLYVDDCYTLERYHKTYSAKFSPVPEVPAWPEASGVPRLVPPVIALRPVIPPPLHLTNISGEPKRKSTRKKM